MAGHGVEWGVISWLILATAPPHTVPETPCPLLLSFGSLMEQLNRGRKRSGWCCHEICSAVLNLVAPLFGAGTVLGADGLDVADNDQLARVSQRTSRGLAYVTLRRLTMW